MNASGRKGPAFTLLELLLAMVLSTGMMLAISLFMQNSLSSFRRLELRSRLASSVQFTLDRLRRCTRHSISLLHNFQNEPPFAAARAFERTETLFFLTDLDENAKREVHFVWFDRVDLANNPQGTDRLIHAWKTSASMPPAFQALFMPPDMLSPGFGALLAYLRDRGNFNGGGLSTVTEGWEVLLDASLDPMTLSRAIHVPRWSPPPWLTPPEPSPGLAFNIDRVVAGAPPLWAYPLNPLLSPVNGLGQAYPTSIPPPQLVGHSFNCQVYADLFSDANGNGTPEAEEARVQLITTLNLLLIPSAGTSSP